MDFFAGIANVGKGIVDSGANFVKGNVLERIKAELGQIPEKWIKGWMRYEVSFLDDYIIPRYGKELSQYKNLAIPMVDSISAQELQQCAMSARPELRHIWSSQEAVNRISSELIAIKQYLSRL
ncbi:MAG: hypothetical protein GWP10_17890 [Nitrospiraceae bacterium]|nr:hypothetical protein [Nitrospiraceae bacterium]